MERGTDSALYIFFTRKIMTVAYQAIKDVSDVFDVPENNEVKHITSATTLHCSSCNTFKHLTLQVLLTVTWKALLILMRAYWCTV
jgi:hypothetical protein